MVSRRKILSRSRDELNSDIYFTHQEEDDVWTNKDKLFQDHIQEIMNKWESIDDEIWAKVIILERNRRVAKAYARAPIITINGSDDGFDGFRIGVAGFDNPIRDSETQNTIKNIGDGFKLKMDDIGNILIKRLSKSPVRVKNTMEENAISNDVIKLPDGLIDLDKPLKVFDMKKFQQNINREIKRTYPDRRKLESQCISSISFGSTDTNILECPIWILIINIVAIEMFRSKLPPTVSSSRTMKHLSSENTRSLININPRANGQRLFGSGSSDEDPYSVAGSGSSGSSGGIRSRDKPPKLPPREALYGPSLWSKSNTDKKEKITDDDPYYSGLRARIPNFVKSRKKKGKETNNSKQVISSLTEGNGLPPTTSHPFWWHARLYPSEHSNHDIDKMSKIHFPSHYITDSSDSDYSHIYGRLPMASHRGGLKKFSKPLFMRYN